ncbi:NOL1 NOP2 sun family protein [Lactobacillus psittaci DSM 15354]|uniref:NOL1 NOP2 sun family protein n=2 Tax=Lactobacillus psittaci TaxID=116089 RepID=A0A0R1S348_9LACO|nr:NOL1 NOP2 sun family protein [Lactobacillus psittaci DSM 15354]
MKIRKYSILAFIFICFLLIGLMVSNLQSLSADQVLTANGLSANSRNLTTKRKISLRTLLQYTEKKFSKEKITFEFYNKYDTDQVLIWSNYENTLLPVAKGKYFTPDQFEGRVSFALTSPTSNVKTLKVQDNQYIVLNNNYISVVGNLKSVDDSVQTKYFITTGVKQANSKINLSNFKIIVDTSSNRVVEELSSYLNGKVSTPAIVSSHRTTHVRRAIAYSVIIIFIMLSMALSSFLVAIINHRTTQMDKIKYELHKFYLRARISRFNLYNIFAAIVSYIVLCNHAFFTNENMLIYLDLFAIVLMLIGYLATILYLKRKEEQRVR